MPAAEPPHVAEGGKSPPPALLSHTGCKCHGPKPQQGMMLLFSAHPHLGRQPGGAARSQSGSGWHEPAEQGASVMGQWRPGPHGMLAVPCPWKSITRGASSPAWGLQGMGSGSHPSPGMDQGQMILSTGLAAWPCLPALLPQAAQRRCAAIPLPAGALPPTAMPLSSSSAFFNFLLPRAVPAAPPRHLPLCNVPHGEGWSRAAQAADRYGEGEGGLEVGMGHSQGNWGCAQRCKAGGRSRGGDKLLGKD